MRSVIAASTVAPVAGVFFKLFLVDFYFFFSILGSNFVLLSEELSVTQGIGILKMVDSITSSVAPLVISAMRVCVIAASTVASVSGVFFKLFLVDLYFFLSSLGSNFVLLSKELCVTQGIKMVDSITSFCITSLVISAMRSVIAASTVAPVAGVFFKLFI
jgi:hypothetical protein